MRSTLWLLPLLAFAAGAAAPSQPGQPAYAVLEYREGTIATIDDKAKSLLLKLPKGGTHRLAVVAKTWIINDGAEGSFKDLRVGQRLQVRYIPRTSQAVTLEVL